MDDLVIAEIFGPTWQGEGPSAGQVAAFVRLGLCNLTCAWCDTAYTWDRSRFDLRAELHRMSPFDVWQAVGAIDAELVVITGGEPLLQQRRLVWLVDMCRARGRRVEIETNGTIAPCRGLLQNAVRFNVSLKLAHSLVPRERRIRPNAVRTLVRAGTARWKFVVRESADLDEVAELVKEYGLAPVWVMPEGTSTDQVLFRMRELADAVLAYGWHLTPRLHTLLWGDERGR
jgi:7-carboxy-7-deazaguanine synthase